MKVLISEKAKKDLRQILSYIAVRNQAAADIFIQAIDERFEQLSRFFHLLGASGVHWLPGFVVSW
jgi:plasmid stabilization system protein ParE